MIPSNGQDMFNRTLHGVIACLKNPLNTSRVSDKWNVTRLKDTPKLRPQGLYKLLRGVFKDIKISEFTLYVPHAYVR